VIRPAPLPLLRSLTASAGAMSLTASAGAMSLTASAAPRLAPPHPEKDGFGL